jgi:hypothetical protein
LSIYRKKSTPEGIVKTGIRNLLRGAGYFVRHVQQGPLSFKGIPDLLATKGGTTLEIEVKSPNGRQSKDQILYQEALEGVGGHYLLINDLEVLIDKLAALGLAERTRHGVRFK